MATVKIGCKLPLGLVMELITPGELRNPAPPGVRVLLKGANTMRSGKMDNPLVAQFAYTDVEEEFAIAWFKANKDALFIKNGSVFMEAKTADAKAAGKERAKESTGMEPLNPDKDERIKRAAPGVEVDKDQLKRLGVA